MKNNKFYFLITSLIIILFFGCEKDNFVDPNDPRFGTIGTGITLQLDQTQQMIDHFGASGGFQDQWIGQWPDATRQPAAELLFSNEVDANGNPKGIGLTLWRSIIGDGAKDQSNSGFRSSSWFRETECYLDANGNYDWTKQAGEQWFMSKAREYGVSKFSLWATTPPYFMTSNGFTFRTSTAGGFNCPQSNYQPYAEFLANVAKHYEDDGYNINTVCAFNETQYSWDAAVGEAAQSGTRAFNSEVAAVTRIMDTEFSNLGVNAKIMIPEAGQLTYLYEGTANTTNQISEFFNPASSNYVGDLTNISNHVAGHSYFSNNSTAQTITQRKSTRDALANAGGGLDYWQTEYSLLGTAYQQGRSLSDLTEMDYALWMSRIIHADLVFGNATGWSFWTAFNQSTFGDHAFRFNLILYTPNANSQSHTDGSFQENKLLWALGNYSRFVRPGMVRFDVNDPDHDEDSSLENFMISGFRSTNSNEIVLVCVNNSNNPRELSFENYGVDFEIANETFDVYTTSTTSNLRKSTANFDDVEIPAKSIVTLTATIQ